MLSYDLDEIKKKTRLNYRIYTSFNKNPLKYYNDDNIPMNPSIWFSCNIMYHKIPMQMAYDILIGNRDELAELCGIIHININDDLQLHSDNDNPSLVAYDIDQDNIARYWHKNGKPHREDGPAIIDADGSKEWYKNGKLHRENGPAVIYANGSKYWYKNGKCHRENGPAVVYAYGCKIYYLNNVSYLKQDWEEKVAELRSKRNKEKS